MNVEIAVEAALFPEKDYINGIVVAEHPGPEILWQLAEQEEEDRLAEEETSGVQGLQ